MERRGHQVHLVSDFSEASFRARWNRKRPDLVYLTVFGEEIPPLVKLAKNMGIPIVMDFRMTIHELMKQEANVDSLYRIRKMGHRATLILVPTQEAGQFVEGLGFERIRVLDRGVDRDLFHPSRRSDSLRRSWGAGADDIVFGIAGRLEPDRNLYMALQNFKKLRLSVGDRMRLVIVGDGMLRDMIASECPEAIMAGGRSGDDLAAHYASMDVLLCTGEFDCFGNGFREGLASGLVVVACDRLVEQFDVAASDHYLRVPFGNDYDYLKAMEYAAGCADPNHPLRLAGCNATAAIDSRNVANELHALLNQCLLFPENRGVGNMPGDLSYSCRTLFLSDIHMGTRDCKARECRRFLKHIRPSRIVLVGDIIDAWALSRGSSWGKKDGRLVRQFLKKMEDENVEIIYLRGNHDEMLQHFIPLSIGRLVMKKEWIHEGVGGKRYLCVHGDGFDAVCSNYRWLAVLGSLGYDVLLAINRMYNKFRRWRGMDYYSVSRKIKSKVKSAVNFISQYEHQLEQMAKARKCDGIIAGHVHHPDDKMIGGIRYMNCGDWVESMSAVIEENDGTFRTVCYDEFMRGLIVSGGISGQTKRGMEMPAVPKERRDRLTA